MVEVLSSITSINMDCNSSSHAPGNPASKIVHCTLDNHGDKGKRWSEIKRSPVFNMFCWFCFSSSSDSDSDDEEERRDKKDEDGVVASMIGAENHFRNVKGLRLSS